MNYLQSELYQLIVKNKIELSLNNIILILDTFDKIYPNENNVTFELRKESILLNARVNKIKNLLENRLISISDENVEYNRMNSSIISIIHRLSENDKLSDYINEISAHVELKTTLEFDNNTNKISDILEDYIHIMGFDHLEMINKIATAQNYKVEYTKIRYPFLRQINAENLEKYKKEISEISYLAQKTFSPGDSMVEDLQLIEWHKASPESWLLFEENDIIKGFIHVEILNKKTSEDIINGLLHEGEIKSTDILQIQEASRHDYVHIGSIISSMDENPKLRYKTSIHLLFGLVERILDIILNTEVTNLFTTSYPDWKGNRNAIPILKKMGFEFYGKKTIEGDPVFELNLASKKNQFLLELFNKVIEYKKCMRTF